MNIDVREATAAIPVPAAALASPELRSSDDVSRGQIAQHLRDHALQQIFAVALEMTTLAARLNEPQVQQRLTEYVAELDRAVTAIYAAISELTRNRQDKEGSDGR